MGIPSLVYLVCTRLVATFLALVPLYFISLFASFFASKFVTAWHLRHGHLSAEDLCQGLIGEVSTRNDPQAPLGDDQTVLVLRSTLAFASGRTASS